MSRPSEPVEIVSISMAFSFLPSFMIEPLPNARSIWVSAASRAFDLSMDEPSTRRRAGWLIIALHMAQRLGIRHAPDFDPRLAIPGWRPSAAIEAETGGTRLNSLVHYLFS